MMNPDFSDVSFLALVKRVISAATFDCGLTASVKSPWEILKLSTPW